MLELFFTLLFFLVFGAFFSPLIGGCLGVFIVFTLLAAFFVFFSLNFIWFVAAGIVIYLLGFVRKFVAWKKLPEVTTYLAEHPDCKLNVGVSCYNCGSAELVNQGLLNKTGKLRFYTCSQCSTTLFRFKVL